jgi:RimJ/RimL family protein N-acetyltransferase
MVGSRGRAERRLGARLRRVDERSATGWMGERQEAHHVDSILYKGSWEDQLVFALLEDEWRLPPPAETDA